MQQVSGKAYPPPLLITIVTPLIELQSLKSQSLLKAYRNMNRRAIFMIQWAMKITVKSRYYATRLGPR